VRDDDDYEQPPVWTWALILAAIGSVLLLVLLTQCECTLRTEPGHRIDPGVTVIVGPPHHDDDGGAS
jgi:hypothetical protein